MKIYEEGVAKNATDILNNVKNFEDEIKKLGGRVIICPPYQKIFEYERFLTDLFKKNNYKIVHSNINTLSIFPLRAAKKAGVPKE